METVSEPFRKGLETIKELAARKKGVLEIKDILSAFNGEELSQEQIKVIYAYLDQQDIQLKDYTPRDTDSITLDELCDEAYPEEGRLTADEQVVFDYYLEDLSAVKLLSRQEQDRLLDVLKTGSSDDIRAAKNRLTEGNLRWVISLARSYAGRGAALGDLIQEGNMALLLAIEEYTPEKNFEDFLEERIRRAMKALLREQKSFDRAGVKMADTANLILETVKDMEEEENRAVTAEEIAGRLGLSVARVDEVLRESAKAIHNAEK